MSSRKGAQMKVSSSFHTMQCYNVGSWDQRGQQPIIWRMSIFCINSLDQGEAMGPILLIALGIWRLPAMRMLHVMLAVGMSGGRIIKDGQYDPTIPYIDT